MRLEAAFTGRPDACPTALTEGFHSRDHLPHLKKEGGGYFGTFRLAGTLPATVLQQFKQEREQILSRNHAVEITHQKQETPLSKAQGDKSYSIHNPMAKL